MIDHLKERDYKSRIPSDDISCLGKVKVIRIDCIEELDIVDLDGCDFRIALGYGHTVEFTLIELISALFLKLIECFLGLDIARNKLDIGVNLGEIDLSLLYDYLLMIEKDIIHKA